MNISTPLPDIWLLSDQRNDEALDQALVNLPQGSGFVYRHYHLDRAQRRARFDVLSVLAQSRGHIVILSGDMEQAREWGADGVYGAPEALSDNSDLLQFATAHNEAEIVQANRKEADALFLSPVFPTRSHKGGNCLGVEQFHRLARFSEIPVIALGGMNPQRAAELKWPRWAAIDGLS